MRIISKFRDYYDNVQGMGSDQTDVYLRENKEAMGEDLVQYAGLNESLEKIPHSLSYSWKSGQYEEHYRLYPVIIGFCGKTYLVYRYEAPNETLHFYNADEVDAFVESYLDKEYNLKKYFPYKLQGWERRWQNRGWRIGRQDFTQANIKEAFEEIGKLDLTEYFQHGKAPTFVIRHRELNRTGFADKFKISFDAPLDEYEFVKIIDPYTAFQEISMYRNGVLGVGEPEMVEISDENKRDAKGFNDMSFKTESPGKKRKRKS